MKKILISFSILIFSFNASVFGQGSVPGGGSTLISVPFSNGAIGTVGTNPQKNNNISTFGTLTIQRAFFQQWTTSGIFQIQGNDINGILRLAFTNGQVMDIPGAVVWRITSGSTLELFGLSPFLDS